MFRDATADNADPIRVKLEHRLLLAQEIAKLIRMRLPLQEALQHLSTDATGTFSNAIDTVNQRLQAGYSLANSLARGTEPATRMLAASIKIGELSGSLDQALDQWAAYQLARQRYLRRVSSALVYPLLLVVVALSSILVSAWRLIPQYKQAFEELSEVQPQWLNALAAIERNFGWISLLLVISTMIVLWRNFGNRQAVDRLAVPTSQSLRWLFYSQIAHMSRLCVRSGQPVSAWLDQVEQCVGLPVDELRKDPDANEYWSHRLGNETSGVLYGLKTDQLSATESESLLKSIADNAQTQADMATELQVHRLPMVTAVAVGVVAMVAYLGLIYLPWLALYYHIASKA